MNFVLALFGSAVALGSLLTGLAFTSGVLQDTSHFRTNPIKTEPAVLVASAETAEDLLAPPIVLTTPPPTTEIKPSKTELGFVGDIMLDRGVGASVLKNFDDDFNRLFENLDFLKDIDILFGNLEGPISDRGQNVGSKYSFRMKPVVAEILANAGFDILSVANNHAGDWGMTAFTDTLDHLAKNQIGFVGGGKNHATASTPAILEKSGLRFGFLAFSDVGPEWLAAKENTPGILLASDNHQEIIKKAAAEVDVLIVSFHWGEEYKTRANARQKNLAHGAIDAGAKIIVGHHPHVIQESERYKDGYIIYSLGNFIFDQHQSEETMRGKLLLLTIIKNPFTEQIEIATEKEKVIQLNKKFQPAEILETKNYLEPEKPSQKKPACPAGTDNRDLLLFNINHKQGVGDFVPSDLVPVGGVCLRRAAAESFTAMKNAADQEGLSLIITSGFRDRHFQATLYDNWWKKNVAAVIKAVAKPNHSEHQLGTALDLTTPAINNSGSSDLFATTKEYAWLLENADKYGFVLSYPAGKEMVTGYKFEPWHWRYVGATTAREMKEASLTPTEALPED